ncbi:MAG: hypothetical protein ACRC5T_06445 [Cetobacterium sp.]
MKTIEINKDNELEILTMLEEMGGYEWNDWCIRKCNPTEYLPSKDFEDDGENRYLWISEVLVIRCNFKNRITLEDLRREYKINIDKKKNM